MTDSTDITTITAPTAAPVDLGTWDDGDDFAATATPFKPNYTPLAGVRILRHRLYADEGGVATATFTGTLDADALWVEGGGSGRLSVYAEVTRGDGDEQTTLRIALVPTGKRVPEDAKRIGSKRGMHAYLLDATVGAKPQPVAVDAADEAEADDSAADLT